MKKRICTICLIIMILILSGCGTSHQKPYTAAEGTTADETSDLSRVRAAGVLNIGFVPGAPLFYKEDDKGAWIGFGADMAQAYAGSLGLKAQLIPLDPADLQTALQEGDVDCVWGRLVADDTEETETGQAETEKAEAEHTEAGQGETKKAEAEQKEAGQTEASQAETEKAEAETKKAEAEQTEARQAETEKAEAEQTEAGQAETKEAETGISWSAPYLKNQLAVVVHFKHKDKEKCTNKKKITQMREFVVVKGSKGEDKAKELGANYTTEKDIVHTLLRVAAGTASCALVDMLDTAQMIGKGTQYENLVYTVTFNMEEYSVGFRKDSDLIPAVNQFLAASGEDGTAKQYAKQYGISKLILTVSQ